MDWKTIEAAFYRWLAYLPVREFRDPAPLVNVLRLNGVIGRLGPVGGGMTLAGYERAIERALRIHPMMARSVRGRSLGPTTTTIRTATI